MQFDRFDRFFFLFQIVNDFIGHLVYIHVSHEDLIEAAKQIRSNVNGKSEFPSQVSLQIVVIPNTQLVVAYLLLVTVIYFC